MNRRVFPDGNLGAGVAHASERVTRWQEPPKASALLVRFQRFVLHAGLTVPVILGDESLGSAS
jgi:hypothetical protein